MKMFRIVQVSILLIMTFVSVSRAQDGFEVMIIDNIGDVGTYADLKAFDDGRLLIAYRSETENIVKTAVVNQSNYTIETIPGTNGKSMSSCLAIDSYGGTMLIHRGKDLYVSEKTPWSNWQSVIVDESADNGNPGRSMALALSNDDRPHVAFISQDGQLFYAGYDQQQNRWVSTLLADGNCFCPSLALTADGRPAIAFTSLEGNPVVRVMVREGAGWQELSTLEGEAASVGIDGNGYVTVCYFDADCLYYRSFIPYYGWVTERLIDDDIEGGMAGEQGGLVLKFDSEGHGHVAYARRGELIYATDRTGWLPVIVVDLEETSPQFLSMDFDKYNRSLIAFYDPRPTPDGKSLKLAGIDLTVPDRYDLNFDGIVNLQDFAMMAMEQPVSTGDLIGLSEFWLWWRNYVN